MSKNTQNTTQPEAAPAQAERGPDSSRHSEATPDYYERLMAARPEDAAGILATLCRRKDYAIRRVLADHQNGISFDDAAKALAEVYKPRAAHA